MEPSMSIRGGPSCSSPSCQKSTLPGWERSIPGALQREVWG
uniref:Uncharacterized protein n=1 Tax=Anguilla anguilla TaxID=7936 RepID=A0A0E9VEC3_ANGAN